MKNYIFFVKELRVHQKSTNFTVLSELGRFPIHYQIIKHMLGYWHHLENLESSFPLLKAAYNSSKNLFLLKKPSWYGSIHYLKEKNTLPMVVQGFGTNETPHFRTTTFWAQLLLGVGV